MAFEEEIELFIIDDDPLIRMIHSKIIEKSKLTACIKLFDNGKSVLDFINNKKSELNHKKVVFLLDVNMPIMNGWELLKAMENEKEFSKYDVYILTSSISSLDREKSKSYKNVKAYLTKPFDITEFIQLLA